MQLLLSGTIWEKARLHHQARLSSWFILQVLVLNFPSFMIGWPSSGLLICLGKVFQAYKCHAEIQPLFLPQLNLAAVMNVIWHVLIIMQFCWGEGKGLMDKQPKPLTKWNMERRGQQKVTACSWMLICLCRTSFIWSIMHIAAVDFLLNILWCSPLQKQGEHKSNLELGLQS